MTMNDPYVPRCLVRERHARLKQGLSGTSFQRIPSGEIFAAMLWVETSAV